MMAAKKASSRSSRICVWLLRCIASDKFFYGVLVVVAIQALWYILSFRPVVNDESRHVANIVIYSQQLSPFLTHQPVSWDRLGEVTRDGSYMFYYLMSWPLRAIRLFTANTTVQLLGLRLVSTAMFMAALVIYRRALLAVKAVPRSVTNFIFLFLVLLPTAAILPATVNYDDMVLLVFAAVVLVAVRILQHEAGSLLELASLVALSLFAATVKWTAIALVLPVMVYVGIGLYICWKANIRHNLCDIWHASSRWQRVLAAVLVLTAVGLFVERPVVNVVQYGRPDPSCQAVVGPVRCEKFYDYVAYQRLQNARPKDFKPLDPVRFGLRYWIPEMLHHTGNVYELTSTEIPSYKVIIGVLLMVSTVVCLVAFRRLLSNHLYRFLLVVLLVYVGGLFLDQYVGYVTNGVPVAIRARYLVPVLPLAGYVIGWSAYVSFGKYPRQLLLLAALVILLVSQGGGITTYALTTPQSVYWDNSLNRTVNGALRSVLSHMVIR